MNEHKQDIERKKRLHEWFKSDPEIWQDLVTEIGLYHNNELLKLKSRSCTNREWSSGYVFACEDVLSLERYYRNQWTPPITQTTIK